MDLKVVNYGHYPRRIANKRKKKLVELVQLLVIDLLYGFASQICVFLSPKRDKLSQKEGRHYKGGMICGFVV